MRNTFSEALYKLRPEPESTLSSPTSRRPAAWPNSASRPRAVHQCRRRRAEYDRHLRRPRAERLPAIRLYDRHVLALPTVRDGARRPLLPEPAGDCGRDRRRRHLLHAWRDTPHAGRHRDRRRSAEHADRGTLRPAGVHRGDTLVRQPAQGPVYLRIGKAGEPVLTADAEPWEFGKLRYLRRGRTSASSATA